MAINCLMMAIHMTELITISFSSEVKIMQKGSQCSPLIITEIIANYSA